jgi:uncharacterized protein (DUF1778 family)
MRSISRKTNRPRAGRTAARTQKVPSKNANLLVRFDSGAKSLVLRAANLRGLSLSDYVRTRIVPLARQDVDEAETGVLRLARQDQIAFWQALQHPPAPTRAQRELGKLVRSVR